MGTYKIEVELNREELLYLNRLLVHSVSIEFKRYKADEKSILENRNRLCNKFFHAMAGILTHDEKAAALADELKELFGDDITGDRDAIAKSMKDLRFT